MLKQIISTVATVILNTVFVSAQSQPAPEIGSHLEMLGFTLGKNTLADVQVKLGKSAAKRCSREEEASKEVCYISSGKDQTKVVFEAGFSGGWKELDGYKVIAGNLQPACYRKCPRASQVTSDIQTNGGLKLGLTREQLIALLGAPKQTRGNKLSFQWKSRQPMMAEEKQAESKTSKAEVADAYYDVEDTIDVTISNSRIVEFEVHHIVTD